MSMDEFAVLPGDLHAVLTLILRDWAGFTMACIDNLPPSISSNFVSPNQAFCWWSLCHTTITYRRLVTCYNLRINFHLSLFTNWFQIEVFISGQPTKEFSAFCHTQKLFISSGKCTGYTPWFHHISDDIKGFKHYCWEYSPFLVRIPLGILEMLNCGRAMNFIG